MNWDEIEGKWKQSMGKVKEKWGKLTDNDLTAIKWQKGAACRQDSGNAMELRRTPREKQVDEFYAVLPFRRLGKSKG